MLAGDSLIARGKYAQVPRVPFRRARAESRNFDEVAMYRDFRKMKLDLENTHMWGIFGMGVQGVFVGVQGCCKPFKSPLQ